MPLRDDERGTVSVEYAVVLTLVSLGCSLAIIATGVPLVRMYLLRLTWVLLPFP